VAQQGSAWRVPSRRARKSFCWTSYRITDPQGTQRIEELLFQLKRDFTIIIVTHNDAAGGRVSDTTTFFYLGTMVETGPSRRFSLRPERADEAYITGRFDECDSSAPAHDLTTQGDSGSLASRRRPAGKESPAVT
jgi:ABC-type multidrug transport system ATPase subunit